MFLKKVDGPRAVTLADGTIMTRADLPPDSTQRWVASRKAAVVRGVLYGLITQSDALRRYGLSEEEFLGWLSAVAEHGEEALKVGTAMPQPGEFSLAIGRAGSENSAVGSQLYPVVTISTLMASFVYPLVFRSHGVIGTNEHWQLLLGANLWGPIFMCRALVPHMRAAQRSDVVMISSVAAQNLGARFGLYSVGKSGMEALAHTLAKEEKEHGMRVNIVAPGLVDTDMGRKIVAALTGSDDIRTRDADAPFGFVCTPQDIAATVLHLCSEDGRYVTDQRITVSGG